MPLPKYEGGVAMSEQEMMSEIERLRIQVADLTRSRERLVKWLCQALRFETDPEVLEREIKEMEYLPPRDVNDVLRDLLPPDMHYLIDNGAAANEETVKA
jgi:hypothetical protein